MCVCVCVYVRATPRGSHRVDIIINTTLGAFYNTSGCDVIIDVAIFVHSYNSLRAFKPRKTIWLHAV